LEQVNLVGEVEPPSVTVIEQLNSEQKYTIEAAFAWAPRKKKHITKDKITPEIRFLTISFLLPPLFNLGRDILSLLSTTLF